MSTALENLGRDTGLRTPDSVATPELARQTGLPLTLLRWIPAFVAVLVLTLVGAMGLIMLTVL